MTGFDQIYNELGLILQSNLPMEPAGSGLFLGLRGNTSGSGSGIVAAGVTLGLRLDRSSTKKQLDWKSYIGVNR